MSKYLWIFLYLGGGGITSLSGQDFTTEEINAYRDQSRQLVSFLSFSMNTLGAPQTTTREKDIIINQSYLKIFRDSEVQVEDDLAGERSTVTNKDVQAYLKDIDFFFKEVQFELNIEDINHRFREGNQLYFIVTMSRNISGITIDGDTLNNSQPRFIEINLNDENRDLKIVSMYTTNLSKKEELSNWWNSMPWQWKKMFGPMIPIAPNMTLWDALETNERLQIGDTLIMARADTVEQNNAVNLSDVLSGKKTLRFEDTLIYNRFDTLILNSPRLFNELSRLANQEELDLSDQNIQTIAPLAKMTRLRRLDISGSKVRDLFPIRNLTRLEVLRCKGTPIYSLQPLKYAINLKELYVDGTSLKSLSGAENFRNLERLHFSDTHISQLAPISQLTTLKEIDARKSQVADLSPLTTLTQVRTLNISQTPVQQLTALSTWENLETLDCSETQVNDLTPLQAASGLRLLFCDNTAVSQLGPLDNLSALRKVYCDQSRVNQQEANRFMRKHPDVLIVYMSAGLRTWWDNLSPDWRTVFSVGMTLTGPPTKEDLQAMANIKEIDISGNPRIRDLDPLRTLTGLTVLNCERTPIESLDPIRDMIYLRELYCSQTQVSSLEAITHLTQLEQIRCERTAIADLTPLAGLTSLRQLEVDFTSISDLSPLARLSQLRRIYADGAQLERSHVLAFADKLPECLVVYRTDTLRAWWQRLGGPWKKVFRSQLTLQEPPSPDDLHQLENIKSINIDGNRDIANLEPIRDFAHLQKLLLSETLITDLSPISQLSRLTVLRCAQSPVSNLSPLVKLKKLTYLDIANTPVEDIDPLAQLSELETLICSGTQIKNLKALTVSYKLKELDCSNTRINSLKPLKDLTALASLTCYNTRLKSAKVADFKGEHGQVQVVYY